MAVSNEKWSKLREDLKFYNIDESKIKEVFCLAGGSGGQKVDKTAVEVQLSYEQIQIINNQTRSREDNRYFARKALIEKVRITRGEKTKSVSKIERVMKQKKRRKKKSKQKYQSQN